MLSAHAFETTRTIAESVFATGQQTVVDVLRDGVHSSLIRDVERPDQKSTDEIIGVLYLDSCEGGALRSVPDQQAIETLAAEAALAIDDARLAREGARSA